MKTNSYLIILKNGYVKMKALLCISFFALYFQVKSSKELPPVYRYHFALGISTASFENTESLDIENSLSMIEDDRLINYKCDFDKEVEQQEQQSPQNFRVLALSSREISLAWDNSDSTIWYYILDYSVNGGPYGPGDLISSQSGQESYSVREGTRTTYRLTAHSESGSSASYLEVIIPLDSVRGFDVSSQLVDHVSFSWVDWSFNEAGYELQVTGYEDFRRFDSFFIAEDSESYRDTEFIVVENLTEDSSYYARVRAVNDIASSSFSEILNFQTPLFPVQKIEVEDATFNSLLISWTKISKRAERTIIEVSASGDFSDAFTIETSQQHLKIEDLLPNTDYFFRFTEVRAENQSPSVILRARTSEVLSLLTSQKKKVLLFPNPALEALWIKTDAEKNAFFQIMDLTGKVVKKGAVRTDGSQKINLTGIRSGSYLLKLFEGQQVSVSKLFIQQ